jgi:hypothetical protein
LGKLAKGFSDREVAVDLGPDYDMTEENSLEGTQRHGMPIIMSVGSTCKVLCKSISNFPLLLNVYDANDPRRDTSSPIAPGLGDRNEGISAVESPEDLVSEGLEHEEKERQVDSYGSG